MGLVWHTLPTNAPSRTADQRKPCMHSPLWPLLTTFSWTELRHHPWRNAAAVCAVLLGVALAFSVYLINASALEEFSQAARSVGGNPDLELRMAGAQASVPEALLGRLARHPEVALASPVLELSTYANRADSPNAPGTGTEAPARGGLATGRVLVRVLGVDALQAGALAPDLLPLPDEASDRLRMFAPASVFLNASARQALGAKVLTLQSGLQALPVQVAGQVRASGSPLVVMDIAAMQDLFGRQGQISRVELRLRPGVQVDAFRQTLQSLPDWPPSAVLAEPGAASQRMDRLSRAYRVNLTVLALIALFTGAFLVYSVLALGVARRAQQLALLAVLGLTRAQRMRLVLLEALVLGTVGSAAGIALGTALAALGLRWLGGDLGGGFFSGVQPALQWTLPSAALYFALGVAAALAGAWWPARTAQGLPAAQTLKGLGSNATGGPHALAGALLLLAGAGLALLPPLGGVPVAAYFSVAALLVGGITALPWLVGLVLDRLAPRVHTHALALLAVERARRVRESAAVAVSGVVASLSLAVALTVMVGSFRHSVTEWLDAVLPASLYVRTAGSASTNDTVYFGADFVAAAARIPGVEKVVPQRTMPLPLDPQRPPVVLIVRALQDGTAGRITLPLKNEALPVPPGRMGIYVSEAVQDLYGAQVGEDFAPLQSAWAQTPAGGAPRFFVAGVWRDYARQFGTIAMDARDFARLSEDTRYNDLALWVKDGVELGPIEDTLLRLAQPAGGTPREGLLEFGSARQIRATSLRIFDRSFAVTYWLQAVAIGIGLFGIAASFSAQVLARRKEFGLLQHLGLTRRQVLQVVAAEGAAWTSLGALAGLALGLAVAVVLVHVVNPQSFHWTMELHLPWARLLALALAVVVAGTVTARLAARAAASRDAVLAVKEDW